jgi:CheY-like chemotaxis protein
MSGKKILLVDNDAVFTKTMSAKLQAEGFETAVAQDGAAAVSAMRLFEPDLVIVDLIFPPDVAHGGGVLGDGFLIVDWLRRIGTLESIPVIMMTASDPAQHAQRARKERFAALFQKTVAPEVWLRTIHQLLNARSAAAAQPA